MARDITRFLLAAVLVAAAIALVITIAESGHANPPNTSSTSNGSSGDGSTSGTASSVSKTDSAYLQYTAQMDLSQQDLAQIAEVRGQDSATVDYAHMTMSDHGTTHSKVTTLAKHLGVTLPTSATPEQNAQADELAGTSDSSFDHTHASMQVTNHKQSIETTKHEIDNGSDPSVIAYAKYYLPIEEKHLQIAQDELDATQDSNSNSNSNTPTTVPAGTGGLAATQDVGGLGWLAALVVGLVVALAGAFVALARPRRGTRTSGPPWAAITAISGLAVALLSVIFLVAGHGRSGPGDFGDDRTAGTATALSRSSTPTAVALPSLHVTAAVDAVGVDHGTLAVPDDPARVGWWTSSAPIGSRTGTTVLDGHVDTARAGAGALFQVGLGNVRVGTEVVVTTAGHVQVTYRVYAQRVYTKAFGLPADVFSQAGGPRLVLITCGGRFDAAHHSYEDNVVVYARPAET
jgi:predicted outer membrane protein